jgi:hypothetical protein
VAQLCRVRALNARTRVREQVRSCGNLERGGPRSREAGTLERGGPRSRAARALERGGPHSRGFEPSSEADLARGGALLGRFGGPRGPPRRGSCCVCVCFVLGPRLGLRFAFFQVLSRIPPGFLDPRGCPRQVNLLLRICHLSGIFLFKYLLLVRPEYVLFGNDMFKHIWFLHDSLSTHVWPQRYMPHQIVCKQEH